METTTDTETFACEYCQQQTDRTEGAQIAPDEWETFAVCEACAEEARDWNDHVLSQDNISDEELAEIIREEEAQVASDMAWMEDNEVF